MVSNFLKAENDLTTVSFLPVVINQHKITFQAMGQHSLSENKTKQNKKNYWLTQIFNCVCYLSFLTGIKYRSR